MPSVAGEPGCREWEGGAMPGLVLLKIVGVGDARTEGDMLTWDPSFHFNSPPSVGVVVVAETRRREEARWWQQGGEKEVSDAQKKPKTTRTCSVPAREHSPARRHHQHPSRTARACVDQTIFPSVRLKIPHHAGYHWKDNFIMFCVNEIVISTTRNVMH